MAKRRNLSLVGDGLQETALAVLQSETLAAPAPSVPNGAAAVDAIESSTEESGFVLVETEKDDVRTLIRDHRLNEAYHQAMVVLEQKIAAGDNELVSVRTLLQHYDIVLSRQPPLSHIGVVALRPSEHLYACFDQFIDLIRQQQIQVAELQAMITELI